MDNQISAIEQPTEADEADYIELQDQRQGQSLLNRVLQINVTNLKKSSERIL